MAENYLPAEEPEAEKNLPYQTKSVLSNSLELLKGYGFSKPEKLKKKTVIDDIFLKGKAFQMNGFAFLYLEQSNASQVPVQAMFAVSKKNFKKASDRNRVKRLMREVWRYQKQTAYQTALQTARQYAVCLMYKGHKIPKFKAVQNNIQNLTERFCRVIAQS